MPLSEEHKKHIAEGMRKWHASAEHRITEEAREKLSRAKKGKKRNITWREKITESLKGRKLSEEHKKHIAEGMKKWHAAKKE